MRLVLARAVAAFVLAGLAAGRPYALPAVPAESVFVSTAAVAEPGVRNGHAMTYDPVQQHALMFGGADASRVLGDMWAWDGRAWARLDETGPEPRTFPAFAYDERRGEAVLFGGNRVLFGTPDAHDTMLGDTWIWTNGRWRRVDVPGPPPRAEAAVAYDRQRARIVLFGGYHRTASRNVRLGDTWEWDGAHWTERASTGPAARNGAAMAYDGSRVVLFGGSQRARDTWEWDGVEWRLRDAGDVPARYNAAMIYMMSARALFRFGGWTGTERAGDSWVLTGGAWNRVPVTGPAARNHATLVYDARRDRAVLFGGHDGTYVFGDTWEWDGARWHAVRTRTPERRVDNGH